ncbi:MAG: FAD-dependent thymidylate synthase [Selenomonadaceae bacterium]|nr:FAD-dependent thymidylate synthase [Selenomonadaceae bacterium]
MKIIEPSAELYDEINPEEILRKLEVCGRVSRKSQPRNFTAEPRNDLARHDAIVGENQIEPRKSVEELRNEAAESFVRSIIKRGHESVLEHVSLTFHIVCDRAIMAELTRHRLASFTVESTRYVKYDELTVIEPPKLKRNQLYRWRLGVSAANVEYQHLIELGCPPEIARSVLPLCLATELYMTANLREWRHVLKLRTDKAAHPQMRFVAGKIFEILRDRLPVIVEDINNE